jgi:hypothetical protein
MPEPRQLVLHVADCGLQVPVQGHREPAFIARKICKASTNKREKLGKSTETMQVKLGWFRGEKHFEKGGRAGTYGYLPKYFFRPLLAPV